jgi:hypothetical protein
MFRMRVPAWMIFLGATALISMSAGIGLVIVSGKSRHALVRTDYYKEGLQLDAHLARERAFDSLGLTLSLREDRGALLVEGSMSAADLPAVRERLRALDLVVQLRRPDDPSADRDVPVTLASDDPLLWVADAEPLRRGRWNARAVFSDSSAPRFENPLAMTAKGP